MRQWGSGRARAARKPWPAELTSLGTRVLCAFHAETSTERPLPSIHVIPSSDNVMPGGASASRGGGPARRHVRYMTP